MTRDSITAVTSRAISRPAFVKYATGSSSEAYASGRLSRAKFMTKSHAIGSVV